jgi:hypothetical protein
LVGEAAPKVFAGLRLFVSDNVAKLNSGHRNRRSDANGRDQTINIIDNL